MLRLAALLLASVTLAAAPLELAPGVHLLRGEFTPGVQPDGNSVILDAPDGLIVIDSGRHAAHTQRIVDFAKSVKRPVAAIVNTHWHLDHIAGNSVLLAEFPQARTYASAALAEAKKGFLADSRKQLEQMIATAKDEKARRAFSEEVARIDAVSKLDPDVVVTTSGSMTIAGRELRIGVTDHAVTASDLWVLDPKSGVLIAGDLITFPAPFLDTACPKGWQQSLTALAKTKFTTLVPGHGAPMTVADVETYRRAFDALLICAASAAPIGKCVDGWTASLSSALGAEDPRFTRLMLEYYTDLLRGDSGKNCP